MRDYEKLAELIGHIHDAALDPALWTEVLTRITEFVGGQACGLVSKDPANKLGATHYYCGVDPHYIHLYSETYSVFDPLATLPPVGQVVTIPDLVSYDEYRRGPFYQEWLQPQGWLDTASVVLEHSGASPAIILVAIPNKAKGMVDDEMRRRIALIAPHARRAVLIGKSMDRKRTEAEAFAESLDGLSAGMFLVDAKGWIVHVNAAGRDMLYEGDLLRSIGGRLVTRNSHIDHTLREVFAAAASGDTAIGTKAIALPLATHQGERYVAHVLPLTSGTRRATGITYTAVAAVFVRKAEHFAREMVTRIDELTPAELRLLLAVAEIGGVPQTAAALGVSETAIKRRLYTLFDKAGVSHQVDLAKIFSGFATPLVG